MMEGRAAVRASVWTDENYTLRSRSDLILRDKRKSIRGSLGSPYRDEFR